MYVMYLIMATCFNLIWSSSGHWYKTHESTVYVYIQHDCQLSNSLSLVRNGIGF